MGVGRKRIFTHAPLLYSDRRDPVGYPGHPAPGSCTPGIHGIHVPMPSVTTFGISPTFWALLSDNYHDYQADHLSLLQPQIQNINGHPHAAINQRARVPVFQNIITLFGPYRE